MVRLPKAAEPLVTAFSVAFTRPTFQRVAVLILGAILSLRQRTVTGMLRAVGPLAKGHWSDFQCPFGRAEKSISRMADGVGMALIQRTSDGVARRVGWAGRRRGGRQRGAELIPMGGPGLIAAGPDSSTASSRRGRRPNRLRASATR
jgi:hypothetical protein